ncbi:MAG: sensor histidine kinase [Chloroflexi bacterium]|nr:sensor histidine kinase [Chloroflexota bacterium]
MKRLQRRFGLSSYAADPSIALVLTLALQLELALKPDVDGPALLNALAGLALTLPLAWRRRAPLAVVLAYAATCLITAVLGGGLFSGAVPLFTALVAGILGFYSLGAYAGSRRTAALGAVTGIVGLWAGVIVAGDIDAQSFGFSAGLVVAAPWLAGRAHRSRHLREAALRELTTQMARDQEQRERIAVDDERARIARELHDVVAHCVGVMVVQAQGARRVLDRQPERAREALGSIEDTGRNALAEMRRSLGVLRREGSGAALEPQPGIGDLGGLVDHARGAGLEVEVGIEGEPRSLPPGVDLSAYRIVQEALTNTIKHAGATRARVMVRYGERELELEVGDDGAGRRANGSQPGAGRGLVGMRERVAVYGGELSARAGRDAGYTVRARIPIET